MANNWNFYEEGKSPKLRNLSPKIGNYFHIIPTEMFDIVLSNGSALHFVDSLWPLSIESM